MNPIPVGVALHRIFNFYIKSLAFAVYSALCFSAGAGAMYYAVRMELYRRGIL